jgi:hypothetical protein
LSPLDFQASFTSFPLCKKSGFFRLHSIHGDGGEGGGNPPGLHASVKSAKFVVNSLFWPLGEGGLTTDGTDGTDDADDAGGETHLPKALRRDKRDF